MFKDFLNDNSFHKEYYIDLCNYIEKHVDGDRPLYAVHGLCTDGGVAGAMIHHQIPEAIIIPLDYKILNHPAASDILSDIKWEGIVDLKPFNKHRLKFWVDHHLSAVNLKVNAERIRFDINGDSGSYQLYLSDFINELPQHLIELAVMTRTTDTAGYITEPPLDTYKSISDIKIDQSTGIEGRKQLEQRIWLLDDAWGSVTTLKEQLQLYQLLAKNGFIGLDKVLSRVNRMRDERKEAVKIADNIDISKDIICFSYKADTIDNFTITRRLQTRGVKVVVSLARVPDGVKISLRRNRNLDENMNSKIQLNELAAKMNGGGHAGASGAKMPDVTTALREIYAWSNKIGLSVNHTELN